jgi:carbonic anhydrase
VTDPADALRLLLEGNQHWVHGQLEHPNQTIKRRLQVAPHQDPFALIFSCIDSRVPPEIVFDRGVGDLFVIRTGAQVLDQGVVFGSIQFGPAEYESCRLIMVLGHERCGAVIAAIESIQTGVPAPGYIEAVVEALRPAYDVAITQPGDLVENMVRAQVELTVAELKADPLLAGIEGLLIRGGRYGLESGAVELIA